MPRVHKHTARQNIYRNGVRTENPNNKRGYSIDRSRPRDDEDTLLVEKGQTYYTWQFKNSPPNYSLTPPTKRQLTRNDYQLALYDIEDEIDALSEASTVEDLQAGVDNVKGMIESLRDEQDDKKNNMPENLQESPAAEILQERYDALESAYDEFDSIDLDYDEPDSLTVMEELGEDPSEDEIEEKREEMLQEWINERVGELQGISLEG